MRTLSYPLLLTATLLSGGVQAAQLNLYNWADYLGPDTLQKFEKETGIKVFLGTFDSDETLEAKMLTGGSGYDLVVVPSDFLPRHVRAGVYAPLDHSKLPNWQNLDGNLLKQLEKVDPGNQYGVPYLWGSVGIGYNVEKVKAVLGDNAPVDSLALMFEPENLGKLKTCGAAFIDGPTRVIPTLLHYLHLDPNTQDRDDYKQAERHLLKLRPSVTTINSTKYFGDLANGDLCVAFGYSGDILQAQQSAQEAGKPYHIVYSLPKEGSNLWFDMFAIPADAKNKEEAYQFIDFMLRPEIIAETANYLRYAQPNQAAASLTDTDLRDNPNIYPSAEQLSRMTVNADQPNPIVRLINRLWTTFKTGH
ncbi:polyamine ABC transporter substrate-binding protein [Phytopseudomonas dryadis]|uniref:Putrescine-binding periplasmic protein n=1 Tax=Phytopseudomonas dryadis TaxID=2487520 RepID=A0A4Q9R5R8_9GAMM|nr:MULTISPECIES: polyamine ABC transporter substrate-binding protein [Pseudomonas]TBU95848.1 spermidine/putrescine ABC transporter substrate-binding protein PotF [Pseudomonas dryadis]TBV09011.1 spermidine/putrescine ABC transporter substrate-binding protein PotF [Pseudomonas dryadis]TBV18226.1 spermidine/putrescine ABC transporter substrate-binding protein PotF [Pseudomonas sp. FRB 230]